MASLFTPLSCSCFPDGHALYPASRPLRPHCLLRHCLSFPPPSRIQCPSRLHPPHGTFISHVTALSHSLPSLCSLPHHYFMALLSVSPTPSHAPPMSFLSASSSPFHPPLNALLFASSPSLEILQRERQGEVCAHFHDKASCWGRRGEDRVPVIRPSAPQPGIKRAPDNFGAPSQVFF